MIIGKWEIRKSGSNLVQLASMYNWKKNYWVSASLKEGSIVYDNPRSVSIPNYVRLAARKILQYGSAYYRITQEYLDCTVDLILNLEASRKADRASYDYLVITPTNVEFSGSSFLPNPSSLAANSKEAIIREILFWIALREGDTDQEFFSRYTARQLDWAKSLECELLAAELSDLEEAEEKRRKSLKKRG